MIRIDGYYYSHAGSACSESQEGGTKVLLDERVSKKVLTLQQLFVSLECLDKELHHCPTKACIEILGVPNFETCHYILHTFICIHYTHFFVANIYILHIYIYIFGIYI